jgi:hypothetical protein
MAFLAAQAINYLLRPNLSVSMHFNIKQTIIFCLANMHMVQCRQQCLSVRNGDGTACSEWHMHALQVAFTTHATKTPLCANSSLDGT